MLNDTRLESCESSPSDISDLRALFLNRTLKRTPKLSHTQGLIDMTSTTVQTTVNPVDLFNVRAIRVTGTAVDDSDDRFEYTRDFEFDVELCI